jgi:hypothetical protein
VPSWLRLTSDRLVGRDAELDAAMAAVGRIQDRLPGVITVSGPAGIGKTRFVTALADRLRAEGKRVLSGACLDLGAGAPPYSAFIAAFRSVDPPAVQGRGSRHTEKPSARVVATSARTCGRRSVAAQARASVTRSAPAWPRRRARSARSGTGPRRRSLISSASHTS